MADEVYDFVVGSTDNNNDVIGVYCTKSNEEYDTLCKSNRPLHSAFENLKDALREAKRLSIGKGGSGAFYVGIIDKYTEFLVFRINNGDETIDYLTTRSAVARVLEVNQDDDIPWETVDGVLEDYENDKEVGAELYEWLSSSDIIAERDMKAIKKLKFYTNDTRTSASESKGD